MQQHKLQEERTERTLDRLEIQESRSQIAAPGEGSTKSIEPDVIISDSQVSSQSPVRRSTGPRTHEGKQRSKQNATRHGIFSSVVVLKGESRAQYESLLNGLWETLLPDGKLEELLVEKLATIAWRQKRLLVAESAEIRKSTEFLEWDQREQEQQKEGQGKFSSLDIIFQSLLPEKSPTTVLGLVRRIQEPAVLEQCLELLVELRQGLETDGFNKERDSAILERIYGNSGKTLYDTYLDWLSTAETSEEERQREGYAAPEQCKQNVLRAIDDETRRLNDYQKARASIESERAKLEILRRSVPDSAELDRLLRYEASLERSFDRTLSQLERLQRMRRGQPVAPRIDVNVSA